MTTDSQLNAMASGKRIFSTEPFSSSKPMSKISMATTRPERYSIRPWPKGWSGSGFCPASLKPRMVTRLESASDRVLKASAVMAIEPLMVPAKNLPTNSSTLRAMPTPPHSTPYCRRTEGSLTCS